MPGMSISIPVMSIPLMSCIGSLPGNRERRDARRARRARARRARAGPPPSRRSPTRRHGTSLLDRDQPGDDGHPGDAHDAQREERRHQRPAAADAPGAVPRAHPQRARPAVAPRAEQEAERAAALAEADVLERRQLVDGRDEERRAGDPAAGAVPREHVARERGSRPRAIAKATTPAPAQVSEVARGEQQRRAAASAACVMREYSATVGATDGNIIAAIITTQTPRNQPNVPRPVHGPSSMPRIWSTVHHQPSAGEREEQRDEPEPGARGGERRGETRAARRGSAADGDHRVRRPRRTRTSTARSCPRTRCRRR